ncbi:heterokaryon incompatibility, partial [Dactylonectria estremocensis]
MSCTQYAALSYCWGKGKTLTAIKHTLPSLRLGFSLRKLPQTIQDTINVSRKLKIKHIWVGALCTIQDSKEDWEKESARMASVYQNAFVTIAAASA